MPDVQSARRRVRTSDHSLLVSLVVTGLLVLCYGVGLKVYGMTSMADGTLENGVEVTVNKLYVDDAGIAVELADGDIDDLNYVTDPADYRTPLQVVVWDQLDKRSGRNDRLVFAEQDLEHLTGEARHRWIMLGFGAVLVLFLGSAIYLNWPRTRDDD
jgi:hypothetical protein